MLDAKMKGQFQCGWKVFSQDNNLDVGDVCAFELISGVKKICFQVVIFRATAEHSPRSPGEEFVVCRTSYVPRFLLHFFFQIMAMELIKFM